MTRPDTASTPTGPFIHVYYGGGKGKTTCAVGLLVRAAGAGLRSAIIQFDKGFDGTNEHYSERRILRGIESVDLFPTGCERIRPDGTFRFGVTEEDRAEMRRGIEIAKTLLAEDRHRLVVLDEMLSCYRIRMLREEEVFEIVEICRSRFTGDLVLTGHKMPPGLEEKVDLVTEMRFVKHYYEQGVLAREGIDY